MTTDHTTETPPAAAPPPVRLLRRSTSDRKVGGVAGGLGAYAGVDPLIFRILFVVLAVFGGSGLLLYALCWLFIPVEGEAESEAGKLVHGRSHGLRAWLVAGFVVLAAVGFLFGGWGEQGIGAGGFALLLIVAVVAVLVLRNGPPASPTSFPSYAAAPDPGSGGSGEYGQTTGTAYTAPAPMYGPVPPPLPTATYPVPPTPPSLPPQPRSPLGRITLSVTLIVVGLLVGWNLLAPDARDVRAVAVLAIALGIVGLGLVVGAFVGRARWLILVGLLLTVMTAAAAAADRAISGGVGERNWAPTTVAAAEHGYRLGFGSAELDLTRLPAGSQVRVPVRVGVGELRIVLDDNATVRVLGHVDAGVITTYDRPSVDGDDLDLRLTSTPDGADNGSRITVDARMGLGELEVVR